jgi:hypothetical protein
MFIQLFHRAEMPKKASLKKSQIFLDLPISQPATRGHCMRILILQFLLKPAIQFLVLK